MIAVIKTGGKQYKVTEGQTFRVESLPTPEGEGVVFQDVLLVETPEKTVIGRPVIDNAAVKGVVTRHGKGDKVLVFKKKKRKQYRRTKGHRQVFTEVKVESITLPE
ncbi:MAG: 50S ribosomal protein L21 [Acidobacteria bacterium]|nr:50S ribosomal protein L21 [Acidobacteriota bacterium]